MKFFWFGVIFFALCVICDIVMSDYSETFLPTKEIRNRVQRTMRVNMRVGKRYGDSEYDEEAPKRKLRMIMRTGKRTLNTQDLSTQQPNTLYTIEDLLADFKRSAPQFLLNPRVGKTDKAWKIHTFENLNKRSDPKSTDLWFGPRIGRANEEVIEDIPWNYIVLNANRPSNSAFKSNDVEEQQNDETTD